MSSALGVFIFLMIVGLVLGWLQGKSKIDGIKNKTLLDAVTGIYLVIFALFVMWEFLSLL
jgi:hypothetical protein